MSNLNTIYLLEIPGFIVSPETYACRRSQFNGSGGYARHFTCFTQRQLFLNQNTNHWIFWSILNYLQTPSYSLNIDEGSSQQQTWKYLININLPFLCSTHVGIVLLQSILMSFSDYIDVTVSEITTYPPTPGWRGRARGWRRTWLGRRRNTDSWLSNTRHSLANTKQIKRR